MANKNRSFPGFVIENTSIAVDFWPRKGYCYLTHLFLTHAHTDHTKGLDATWDDQMIHCTTTTKKLMMDLKGIHEKYFVELSVDRTYVMKFDDTESFNVTLIDANHCPGAVMYLFQGYFGCVLATGDFRYSPSMFTDTPLKDAEVDKCYLDNTYLNEKFADLPSRDEAFNQIVELIEKSNKKDSGHAYLIKMKILGKENLIQRIYSHFLVPIVCSYTRYMRYTKVLELDEKMFTHKPSSESFIFLEDNELFSDIEVETFLSDKKILNIEPTALNIEKRRDVINSHIKIPYTDHSSYTEIHTFVKNLRPKKITPIVWQPLPNKLLTTDTKCLLKYLSKKPGTINNRNASDTYKLLLKSSTSAKRGSVLHSFQLRNGNSNAANVVKNMPVVKLSRRPSLDDLSPTTPEKKKMRSIINITPIPTNNITRRRKSSLRSDKKEIIYETPEKVQKTHQIDDNTVEMKEIDEENRYPNSSTPKSTEVLRINKIGAYKLMPLNKDKMETIKEISVEMSTSLETSNNKLTELIEADSDNLLQAKDVAKAKDALSSPILELITKQTEVDLSEVNCNESIQNNEMDESSIIKIEKEDTEASMARESSSYSTKLNKNANQNVEITMEADVKQEKLENMEETCDTDEDVDMENSSQNVSLKKEILDKDKDCSNTEVEMNESQDNNDKISETHKECASKNISVDPVNQAENLVEQNGTQTSDTKMSFEEDETSMEKDKLAEVVTGKEIAEKNTAKESSRMKSALDNESRKNNETDIHQKSKSTTNQNVTQNNNSKVTVNTTKSVTKLINELHGDTNQEQSDKHDKSASKNDDFFDNLTYEESSDSDNKIKKTNKSPVGKVNKEKSVAEKKSTISKPMTSKQANELQEEQIEETSNLGNVSGKSVDLFDDFKFSSSSEMTKSKQGTQNSTTICESDLEISSSEPETEYLDATTFIEETKDFYKFMFTALKGIDEIDPVKSEKNVRDFYMDRNRS